MNYIIYIFIQSHKFLWCFYFSLLLCVKKSVIFYRLCTKRVIFRKVFEKFNSYMQLRNQRQNHAPKITYAPRDFAHISPSSQYILYRAPKHLNYLPCVVHLVHVHQFYLPCAPTSPYSSLHHIFFFSLFLSLSLFLSILFLFW